MTKQDKLLTILRFLKFFEIISIADKGQDIILELRLKNRTIEKYQIKLINKRVFRFEPWFRSDVSFNSSKKMQALNLRILDLSFHDGKFEYIVCGVQNAKNQQEISGGKLFVEADDFEILIKGERILYKSFIEKESEILRNTINEYKRKSPNKILSLIVKNQISPFLKSFGFEPKKNQFIKHSNDIVQIIEIKKSRWNTSLMAKFSLQIKIYVGNYINNQKLTSTILFKNGMLIFSKPLGYLIDNESYSYQIDISTIMELESQIQNDITNILFPFLKNLKTIEDIILMITSENEKIGYNFFSLGLAISLAKIGRTKESKKFFEESIGDRDILRRTAKKYNIDLIFL